MKIDFLVFGKTSDKRIDSLTQEYVGRICHYVPFQIVVIPSLKNTKHLTECQQKEQECEQLKRFLRQGDYVVLLDERGAERRSIDFASWLQGRMVSGSRRLVFVSGGPYGFADQVYDIAQEKLSLSLMTFSHQMIRLLFAEQLYRAMTILKGEPYHHE